MGRLEKAAMENVNPFFTHYIKNIPDPSPETEKGLDNYINSAAYKKLTQEYHTRVERQETTKNTFIKEKGVFNGKRKSRKSGDRFN